MRITQATCDYCGGGSGVRAYTINEGGRAAVVDACKACAKPLEQAFEVGSSSPRALPVARRKVEGHEFIPIEDL